MKVIVRIRPKALLTILAKRNMSQNGLGRGAELQSGHVSQLISGKRNVSPETRIKILKALNGVQFDEIFVIRQRN
ncbi:MAG: helix-turn-helix domain-containing protein [Limisphaerales bacterium]